MGGLGGGGMSGFMTTRGTANLLTRTTRWLAGAFMATSLVLAYIASRDHAPAPIVEPATPTPEAPAPAPSETGGTAGSSAPASTTSGTGSTTGTTPSAPAVPTNQ